MDASYYKEKYEPINGKWYIKELLGEGSYGKVFRIEYKDVLGKTTEAALKVITIPQSEKEIDSVREALQDDNSVNQYFTNMASKIADEFNVMAQLKGNTNIVSYEEHDIFPHENGIGYDILIRMELLKPLNKLTDTISEQEVIKLGIDICKALEVCQKHNIVHRDIKPENIFVSPMGDYKLGDFGVAKTMKHEMTVMTVTGTYVYMAPELKKGEECGTNVDIYSLGMVMYKLLNFNREPFLPLPPEMFTFEQREQALINRMKGMPLPKPANASERLAEIILKACEYNPKTRYESPVQMRMELESLLVKTPIETPTDIPEQTDDARVDDRSELDETLGLFGKENDKDKGYDETVGIFSKKPEKPVSDDNLDETIGIFDEQFSEVAEDKKGYKVIIFKESKMPWSYDVAIDGVVYETNIKDKTSEFFLNAGEHQITIQLYTLTAYEKQIKNQIITDKIQKQWDSWKKQCSVSVKVCKSSKITFVSDLKLIGHDPSLKITSVEAILDNSVDSDSKKVMQSTKSEDTYSVAINRKDQFYAKGLYGPNGYAVEIFVDGVSVAKDITEDYILNLTKGEHFVEIGVCSNSNLISGIASILKKAKFTASNRGEICYGFDRVWGGLKIFSMKGNLRK